MNRKISSIPQANLTYYGDFTVETNHIAIMSADWSISIIRNGNCCTQSPSIIIILCRTFPAEGRFLLRLRPMTSFIGTSVAAENPFVLSRQFRDNLITIINMVIIYKVLQYHLFSCHRPISSDSPPRRRRHDPSAIRATESRSLLDFLFSWRRNEKERSSHSPRISKRGSSLGKKCS